MRTLRTTVARKGLALQAVQGYVERRRHPLWWPIAAALLLALGAVVALLARRPTPADEVASISSPSPQARASTSPPRSLASQSPVPRSPRPSRVARIRIPQGTAHAVDVDLRSRVQTVRFEVAVDDRNPSYDVKVQTADGKEVWRGEGLTVPNPGEPLVVAVPAEVLASGDLTLAVEGEALRRQRFSVEYHLKVVR